jgi:stage III sporulation protein AB
MWLKLTGCLLIIIAGSTLGFQFASRYEERLNQIQQLIHCLTTLESYIEHVAMPLVQAFRQITQGMEGPIADLFTEAAALMENSLQLTPAMALQLAFDKLIDDLRLEQKEQELLLLFAANLVIIDPKGHSPYFAMIRKQLRDIQEQARQNKASNAKMFRYLGICGSLVLVILLL